MTRALKKARSRARITWFAATGLSAGVVYIAYTDGFNKMLVLLLGLIFAGYVVASRSIARKSKNLATAIIAGTGASAVFWIHPLYDVISEVVRGWSSAGLIPAHVALEAALPATIGVAGIMMGALLHLSTSRVTTIIQSVAVTGVAALAPLSPQYTYEAILASIVLWQAVMCESLCRWAVKTFQERSANECPHCGFNLEHMTTPLCPACQRRLPQAGPLHAVSSAYSDGPVPNPFDDPSAERDAA